MTDPRTEKPAKIARYESGGGGSFSLARDRVGEIRAVLDQHAVPYWMDSSSISVDGRPFVSRIVLSVKADIDFVQQLLDTLP